MMLKPSNTLFVNMETYFQSEIFNLYLCDKQLMKFRSVVMSIPDPVQPTEQLLYAANHTVKWMYHCLVPAQKSQTAQEFITGLAIFIKCLLAGVSHPSTKSKQHGRILTKIA